VVEAGAHRDEVDHRPGGGVRRRRSVGPDGFVGQRRLVHAVGVLLVVTEAVIVGIAAGLAEPGTVGPEPGVTAQSAAAEFVRSGRCPVTAEPKVADGVGTGAGGDVQMLGRIDQIVVNDVVSGGRRGGGFGQNTEGGGTVDDPVRADEIVPRRGSRVAGAAEGDADGVVRDTVGPNGDDSVAVVDDADAPVVVEDSVVRDDNGRVLPSPGVRCTPYVHTGPPITARAVVDYT